ncbi:MAG: ABC transporter ATP-binding protein/permease [Symbiobacteriaceae bacterium]|nr:ABC transporter ATP-binding protein/permease [Symbiobacteriaceae bacterium]
MSERGRGDNNTGRTEVGTRRAQNEYIMEGSGAVMGRVLRYFLPVWKLFVAGVLLAMILNVSQIIRPYIIKVVIDNYLGVGRFDFRAIALLAFSYFAAIIISGTVSYIEAQINAYRGRLIVHRIRTELFDHVQSMTMTFFDNNASGSLLTRIINDVESLNQFYSSIVVHLVQDIVLIIGVVGTMLSLSPKLTLTSALIVPPVSLFLIWYRRAARANYIQIKAKLSQVNAYLAENINGMRLVQIFNRQKEKFDLFHQLGKEYYDFGFKEIWLNSLGHPFMNMLNNLTATLFIIAFSRDIELGALEVGTLYAFISYIQQIFNPISSLASEFNSIQSAFVSAERIFSIMDNHSDLEDLDAGEVIDECQGRIEFKNVWFAYVEDNWVLKDVSFVIEPGQTVGFVGATGSGKSTIISLIARFYTVQKGEILLDGKNVNELNLTSLRRNIAVVMQDVFLFSGDISSNIRLNNTNITDEEIVTATKLIGADRFVESLPDHYQHPVMERGATFSAGQRQLISFARAMAFQPKVLVLDEATASIDTETELLIQDAMRAASKDRTTLIIAHRLSTIREADQIIVLSLGVIIEKGTHDELIASGGRYAELYKLA